jgi:hypothetical protein
MLKVSCLNCGHNYKVKDKLKGKTLKCPNCGEAIKVEGERAKDDVSQEDMRAELLRLAGGAAAGEEAGEKAPPSGKKKKPRGGKKKRSKPPSETEEESVAGGQPEPELQVEAAQKDYTGLLVGLVVFLILGLGGVYGYVRYQSYQQGQQAQKERDAHEVEKALAAARQIDDPCARQEAADAWMNVRDLARDYEQQYGDGRFVDVLAQAGSKVQALRAAGEKHSSTVRRMESLLTQSRRQVQQENYKAAKKNLETAITMAKELECPDQEVNQLQAKAEQRLASDPVRYGSKGWVLYEGEWMPPAKRQKLAQQAKEEAMREKGLVKYDGRWMEPEMAKRLKNVEEKKREMARRRAEAQKQVREQLQSGASEILLDSGEQLRWSPEGWANQTDMSVKPYGEGGAKFVTCRFRKGSKDKWVISLPQNGDIRPFDELRVEVVSPDSVRVAVGVWTQPGFKLHEGRPKRVKTGKDPETISFDLKAGDFKSKKSKWRHSTKVEDPDSVYRLSLFFYSRPDEPVRFRNVRLMRKGEGGNEE